jgi:hypothetical protein
MCIREEQEKEKAMLIKYRRDIESVYDEKTIARFNQVLNHPELTSLDSRLSSIHGRSLTTRIPTRAACISSDSFCTSEYELFFFVCLPKCFDRTLSFRPGTAEGEKFAVLDSQSALPAVCAVSHAP